MEKSSMFSFVCQNVFEMQICFLIDNKVRYSTLTSADHIKGTDKMKLCSSTAWDRKGHNDALLSSLYRTVSGT